MELCFRPSTMSDISRAGYATFRSRVPSGSGRWLRRRHNIGRIWDVSSPHFGRLLIVSLTRKSREIEVNTQIRRCWVDIAISRNSKFLLQRSRKAPIKRGAWIGASAASVEAAFQVGALRLREPASTGDALHFDSTAEPVNLTNSCSGRPSAAAERHR
jgi:hypothetical protein